MVPRLPSRSGQVRASARGGLHDGISPGGRPAPDWRAIGQGLQDRGRRAYDELFGLSLIAQPLRHKAVSARNRSRGQMEKAGTPDLTEIRARVRGTGGKRYWRSLEAIAETPEFQEYLHREFP